MYMEFYVNSKGLNAGIARIQQISKGSLKPAISTVEAVRVDLISTMRVR